MRSRGRAGGGGRKAGRQGREPTPRERIAGELAELGVAEEAQPELSRRLEPLSRVLAAGAWEAALAGVALAHGLHREQEQALRRSVRDLGEVQRLLGAFAEEMGKLDEALAILTTYVKRMRARSGPAAPRPRWLH